MANERPNLYTIRIGAKLIYSQVTREPLCATLQVAVEQSVYQESGSAQPAEFWDGNALLVRPGDFVCFDRGEIELGSYKGDPEARIVWKETGSRPWKEAPTAFGKIAQVPPKSGFAKQRLAWRAELDLGANLQLGCQQLSPQGNTVIVHDPDIIVDES